MDENHLIEYKLSTKKKSSLKKNSQKTDMDKIRIQKCS